MTIDLTKLSSHLFWDTDIANVDLDKHWRFIIIRVIERGNLDDVKQVWNSFGVDMVCDALTHARSLSRQTISFFANQFGLKPSDFRASSVTESSAIWNS